MESRVQYQAAYAWCKIYVMELWSAEAVEAVGNQ